MRSYVTAFSFAMIDWIYVPYLLICGYVETDDDIKQKPVPHPKDKGSFTSHHIEMVWAGLRVFAFYDMHEDTPKLDRN